MAPLRATVVTELSPVGRADPPRQSPICWRGRWLRPSPPGPHRSQPSGQEPAKLQAKRLLSYQQLQHFITSIIVPIFPQNSSKVVKKTVIKINIVYRILRIQLLTTSRWMDHRVRVGGASVCGLLLSVPVGVACCCGAVRDRETRWAASHRWCPPRHAHLWCASTHHHGNKKPTAKQTTTTTTQSQNELVFSL